MSLIICAKSASRTGAILPSCGQLGDRLVEELILGALLAVAKPVVGQAERAQDLPRVDEVEQVDGGEVLALDQPDLESLHEPGGRHREVVAHQDEALDVGPVALPQRLDELASVRRSWSACSHCSN